MSTYRVCVYAICKNEEQFVQRWMDSMKEADLVVVTDTGSTDCTVEKLEARGAVVYRESIVPWRFDTARNRSLQHVPAQTDICVCTDLDEVFVPGWREKLEAAWRAHRPRHTGPIAKTGRYLYNWSLRADGTPQMQFPYFKIHERKGFVWKCPVHEVLQYTGRLPLETVFLPGVVLNHYPDAAKPRTSYLPLLELGVREDPQNERMRYYLGREYLYRGEWEKCRLTLRAYLQMPTAAWAEERGAAMRQIAQASAMLGDKKQAYAWYLRAVAQVPWMREPYVEFARWCYEQRDWPMTLCMAKEALKLHEKSKTYINLAYAWDATPDDLCCIAAYRMGLYSLALQHARRALAYAPQDRRLQENCRLAEQALREASHS